MEADVQGFPGSATDSIRIHHRPATTLRHNVVTSWCLQRHPITGPDHATSGTADHELLPGSSPPRRDIQRRPTTTFDTPVEPVRRVDGHGVPRNQTLTKVGSRYVKRFP